MLFVALGGVWRWIVIVIVCGYQILAQHLAPVGRSTFEMTRLRWSRSAVLVQKIQDGAD